MITSPEAMNERKLTKQVSLKAFDQQYSSTHLSDREKMIKKIQRARSLHRNYISCLKCGLRVKVEQALQHYDQC